MTPRYPEGPLLTALDNSPLPEHRVLCRALFMWKFDGRPTRLFDCVFHPVFTAAVSLTYPEII